MNKIFKNPIILALDVNSLTKAQSILSDLKSHIGGVKLGMEFFNSFGPDGVREISKLGIPIFLDLKLHDIPITVYKTIKTLMELDIAIINVHSSGGRDMLEAAAKARSEFKDKSTKLIAVTVLTSLDDNDIEEIGYKDNSEDLVLRLASLAKDSGLDGVVCSAKEISLIKSKLGKNFILVVPGIRLEKDNKNDQKRVMSPKKAINAGADLLVIGRPITDSKDPLKTIDNILENIKQ
jgi:orotidine-5'-phosphate decarboxylase